VVDVFEEVEGELRADRYRRLARQLLPWLIGAALLALAIAGGVWFYNQQREQKAEAASQTYAAALTAGRENKTAESERLFRQVAEDGTPVYQALALQHLAAIKVAANQPRQAVPLLDEAAEAAPEESLADAARLKAAFLVMDYAPPAEAERRLAPLTEEGRPYRLLAREALGMTRLAAGRPRDARRDFLVISQALDAPEQAQARAQAMIAAIDSGAAGQVPALLRAAPAPAVAAPVPPGQGAPAAAPPAAPAAPAPSPAQ
jgi:hypothetical protein